MKALFGSALAAAFLLGLAHSLRCYSCNSKVGDTNCTKVENCTQSQGYCIKATTSVYGVTNFLLKGCVAQCSESWSTSTEASASISCCKTDLCNGATSARVSSPLLSLTLGVVVFLLSARL